MFLNCLYSIELSWRSRRPSRKSWRSMLVMGYRSIFGAMAKLWIFPLRNCGRVPKVRFRLQDISRIPKQSLALPFFFREREPTLRHISQPFEDFLHFTMLFLEYLVIRVFGHLQRRRDDQNCARVRLRNLHQVPCFLERPRAFEPHVKQNNGPARAARQHHWTRLRDIPRTARAVDGKTAIDSFRQPPRHHG